MLFETIATRLSQMPQLPLMSADHGPCMNCSFTNELLIEFYSWLFTVVDPESYARLDQAVMRRNNITHYDYFLPRYRLPREDFLDSTKNVFWCVKAETLLAALREVLGDQTEKSSEKPDTESARTRESTV
jgi:hypothetical protein